MRFRVGLSAALAVLTMLAGLVASPASASGRGDQNTIARYRITFENITHGQYFTPPNFAVHNRNVDVFSRGQAASPGLQGVAENGDVPGLAAELAAAVDGTGNGTSGVGDAPGPIGPGEAITFEVDSNERRLSIASMVICSNDGFAGLDSKRLPRRSGQSRTYYLRAYDAGTEINTEAREDLVPAPFCGPGDGTVETNPALAENGVVRRHQGIQGVGDLDPDTFGWRGPVVKVTVARHDVPLDVDYEVTFENLTGGQYFTPPNWAIHSRYARIFVPGDSAGAGLQGVAENGDVPGLAEELAGRIDDTGSGASGVGDAPGPIGPGQAITFDVSSSYRRLSIASMVICTNDGFAGLDSKRLPTHDGETRTYYLRAYDAGTEINTEAREDLVPAPFCGPGDGTVETNPALAEYGVIRPHRGIQGVGDLDPAVFGWEGPVVKVTVTRHG